MFSIEVQGADELVAKFDRYTKQIEEEGKDMQYTLTAATCKGGFENNTRDGQVRVRWEGVTCEEVAL